MPMVPIVNNSFFFYNVTATTEIYTLSLHDALPISLPSERVVQKRLTPRLPHVGRGIGRLRQTHWRRIDDVIRAVGHEERLDDLGRREGGACRQASRGDSAARGGVQE